MNYTIFKEAPVGQQLENLQKLTLKLLNSSVQELLGGGGVRGAGVSFASVACINISRKSEVIDECDEWARCRTIGMAPDEYYYLVKTDVDGQEAFVYATEETIDFVLMVCGFKDMGWVLSDCLEEIDLAEKPCGMTDENYEVAGMAAAQRWVMISNVEMARAMMKMSQGEDTRQVVAHHEIAIRATERLIGHVKGEGVCFGSTWGTNYILCRGAGVVLHTTALGTGFAEDVESLLGGIDGPDAPDEQALSDVDSVRESVDYSLEEFVGLELLEQVEVIDQILYDCELMKAKGGHERAVLVAQKKIAALSSIVDYPVMNTGRMKLTTRTGHYYFMVTKSDGLYYTMKINGLKVVTSDMLVILRLCIESARGGK